MAMFKKLLNVGRSHSVDKFQLQSSSSSVPNPCEQAPSPEQQLRDQFHLNEIKSYGFTNFSCLTYSNLHSLLAVGSKNGLVRVFGGPSIEFSYQLACGNAIRQLEFITSQQYTTSTTPATGKSKKNNNNNNNNNNIKANNNNNNQTSKSNDVNTNIDKTNNPKLVCLTDNGVLHLLELKSLDDTSFVNIHTQTDAADCCQDVNDAKTTTTQTNLNNTGALDSTKNNRHSSLEYVGSVNYFMCNLDDDDRSNRISTFEIAADGETLYVGTEGGTLYIVPLSACSLDTNQDNNEKANSLQKASTPTIHEEEVNQDSDLSKANKTEQDNELIHEDINVSMNVEYHLANSEDPDAEHGVSSKADTEPFVYIKFDTNISESLSEQIKFKKPGAIESINKHPQCSNKILISYHRGLSVIYDLDANKLDKYFYHNQVLESSCFAPDQTGNIFYTSHNDGSYIRWDCRIGSQASANKDSINQPYGPYPCKPTPKIVSCTALMNDQLEELVIFSDGMPRATYDDKNPVTIVHIESDVQNTIKTVLDFTSKVLDFVVITKPRANLGPISKHSGQSGQKGGTGGGRRGKNKHHNQQQQNQQLQRNAPIAVALAILTEEEFVVIDMLNSTSFLEFPLPYLNCIHSSAITCNQLYADISDNLYETLQTYSKKQVTGKLSSNEWPINGGKITDQVDLGTHDILLTGHEDGSVNIWDISHLSMRHLLHISTSKFFSTGDEDLISSQDESSAADQDANRDANQTDNNNQGNHNDTSNSQESGSWPPLKRVGRFDPFSDDARLAIRRLSLCTRNGLLVAAGTGGQVLALELKDEVSEAADLTATEVTLVTDRRFVWKGHDRLPLKGKKQKQPVGYQLASCLQLVPPVSATSLELRTDWNLFALGTSYGFLLFDYRLHQTLVVRSTLNPADFAIISGDPPGTMSRKKSFRKSLRESFRRLRLGRSMRQQQNSAATTGSNHDTNTNKPGLSRGRPAFSRPTTGVRTLNATGGISGNGNSPSPLLEPVAPRSLYSGERQVEVKQELSSIVRCLSLNWSLVGPGQSLKPSLWVGTNGGQVLIYSITLAGASSSSNSNNESSNRLHSQQQQQQQQQDSQNQQSEQDNIIQVGRVSSNSTTSIEPEAKLVKEIQLKHRAPIAAVFVNPNHAEEFEPQTNKATSTNGLPIDKSSSFDSTISPNIDNIANGSNSSTHDSNNRDSMQSPTPETSPRKTVANNNLALASRVLICTEEQFKVFTLPNFKPFCKFKLTANEGLRARKVCISYIPYEPFLVCMSNQGDCAIYSVPELKRQAQVQVCSPEDFNGIQSTMLTQMGEGCYLKSSTNFLRFSLSNQRRPRVYALV